MLFHILLECLWFSILTVGVYVLASVYGVALAQKYKVVSKPNPEDRFQYWQRLIAGVAGLCVVSGMGYWYQERISGENWWSVTAELLPILFAIILVFLRLGTYIFSAIQYDSKQLLSANGLSKQEMLAPLLVWAVLVSCWSVGRYQGFFPV